MYIDNPNAIVNIQKTDLDKMYASVIGGVWYVRQGAQLNVEYSTFSDVNATYGAMMYSISLDFTFNSSNSDYQCLFTKRIDVVNASLDLSKWEDGSHTGPNTTNWESTFYIQYATGINLFANTYKYCYVPKEGGVFQMIQTAMTDQGTEYTYNAGVYGGVINCNACQLDLVGTRIKFNIAYEGGALYV